MRTDLTKHYKSIVYITLHAKQIFHNLRWPTGVVCPYCGEVHIWHYKNGTYKCSHCNKRFSDTSNTIFHASKIKIEYWLIALYLLTMSKGISSEELSHYLGITQKSCWYMLHKIRYAFRQDGTVLTGDVAVDEVYLGGKWSSVVLPKKIDILKKYGLWYEDEIKRTWHKRNVLRAIAEYKQPVYGMNDGSKIVLQALPNHFNSGDLLELTNQYISECRHLVSDQSKLYKEISKSGIDVIQMNHSQGEYKKDGYSSNRIEGTFSHLKRRYRLNYVRPNKKYIQLYLNEFCFRWNNREEDSLARLATGMNLCVSRGKITRKDIDLYDWKSRFKQREKKHRPSIDDYLDGEWPGIWEYIEIDGIQYDKEEFYRLKELRRGANGSDGRRTRESDESREREFSDLRDLLID